MTISTILLEVLQSIIRYFRYDWWILALGIGTAVGMKVYAEERMSRIAQHRSSSSIVASVGVGAFTPLCACGTMAVLLSMFATALPWGTVMAFLLTSPLTSPTQFIFQAGFLGTRLAVAGLVSALALGLSGGLVAMNLEKKTEFFTGQYRLTSKPSTCSNKKPECCLEAPKAPTCCSKTNRQKVSEVRTDWFKRIKLDQVILQTYELGVKRVLLYFAIFIALGRLVEMFVPAQSILMLFSPDKFYSIPLAALIGLPLYVSGAAGLPLLESFLQAGAGEGAILAFLIAGQGTSVGVMIGIATFIKKKAIAFYITAVLIGAIISGAAYQLIF